MTLRADGPEYVPLRTFRDDDLLDPGSDPLIALMGALSALQRGERVVARLMLRSLGPDWSQAHLEKAHKRPGRSRRDPLLHLPDQAPPDGRRDDGRPGRGGAGRPARATCGCRTARYLEGRRSWALGTALGLAVGGLGWWRWKKARKRVYDPLLIKEKVSRIAFDAEIQVTPSCPPDTGPQRAEELLEPVAAAYRHYDNPAGARFKVGKVKPAAPDPRPAPAGPGLFGKRSVLGVREAAALWHPPGARDETPLVERSGARALCPRPGVRGGALVGDTTAGKPREIRFPDDLLRRHHLYVARTRMGKSTLMHHIVAHKMREKAAGRDGDAIVVVDPHADLVAGCSNTSPSPSRPGCASSTWPTSGALPGINLLDTRIFADRDRTADSVVRVAKGLWEQWGPRMQSILEQTVKTLHEANEHPETDADEQYTILDGLRSSSDDPSATRCWPRSPTPTCWSGGPGTSATGTASTGRGPGPGADPPLLLRLLQAGAGHPGPAPLHHRPAGDHPGRRHPAGLHRPGDRGQGRGRPGGRVPAQPGGRRDPGAGRACP